MSIVACDLSYAEQRDENGLNADGIMLRCSRCFIEAETRGEPSHKTIFLLLDRLACNCPLKEKNKYVCPDYNESAKTE